MSKNEVKIMDSHAHLTSDEYPINVDSAIENAIAANVSKIMNICTSPKELEAGLLLEKKYPDIIRNIASTTPHDAEIERKETYAFFEKQAKEGNLVAIGETGFDDFIKPDNTSHQQVVCRSYIDLGIRYNLPVVFHVRGDRAFDDVFTAASEFPSFQGVIHCFTGTMAQAEKALALGWHISISGIATFKKSEALREVIKSIPMERLLIETDSPWLAPTGYRGKDNEPAYIKIIVEIIATTLKCSVEQVCRKTYENGCKLFSI